jgi:hypothetical protein
VVNRSSGYPNRRFAPLRAAYPPRPATASGTCTVVASTATSRNPRQNTPGVPGQPTGPHTASNNARNGAAPTRRRARHNPDTDGRRPDQPIAATSFDHTSR